MLSQVSNFDIRLLRTFKIIVGCGSSSAAESTLGPSRSATSLRVDDLEKCLDMRLCQRGRAGFALTDEGREVYYATQTLLAALEGFRAEASDSYQHLRGEFSIGVVNSPVTLPQMHITHVLSAFRGQGPQVWTSIGMITPNEIELSVLDGHPHIGVVPLISPSSGLEYLSLYDEHAQLYCGRDHTLSEYANGDIVVDEMLVTDAMASSYHLPAEVQAHHRGLNNSASASDRKGMVFLTPTGNFIGCLSPHYTADWVAAGILRSLLPERSHYIIVPTIVVHKGHRPNPVLKRFPEAVVVSRGCGLSDASFGCPPNGAFLLAARRGDVQ